VDRLRAREHEPRPADLRRDERESEPPQGEHFRRHARHLGREFGRTIYSQGKLTPTDYGRDHHPRCFSLWMAGGGVKGGVVYGETDEFSYK
jgi:hypothetical protein